MVFYYKVIGVDLDAERARIKKVRYTGAEKKLLRELCDLIENHDIEAAIRMTKKWTREQREFIGEPIWDVLWNMSIENRAIVGRAKLERLWKQRDKKGLTT